MSIERLRRRARQDTPAFAGVLLLTLLGVIGMHGLTSHGVHGSEAGHSSAPVTHQYEHAMAELQATFAAGPQNGSTDAGLVTASCLAILIGLGFALWTLRQRRPGPASTGRERRPYSPFIARPYIRGPPTLAELSILRC